jgi:hypothetical protein
LLVIVAPVSTSRIAALLAGAWTAAAAWISFGGIAFNGPDGARIGVLPVGLPHVAIALLAALIVIVTLWRARPSAIAVAIAPLVLVFLPWLPIDVPAPFLAWSGALGTLAWTGVAAALVAIARPSVVLRAPGRRPALLPGVLAVVVFGLAAVQVSPSLPAGDEPHYLVIAQSLLRDGDLRIENNHQRGDYRAYFAGDLAPHSLRRGRNGEIYSIHAPGVPALVAPAFAIAGYPGVVIFLILLSAAGCALAWWLAWRVTGSASAAWFGWAVVTLAAPFLLESFTVFPDGPGAVVVLTGFWALLRAEWESAGRTTYPAGRWWPWLLHGATLALLPWLHTRFSVLAGTLGGLILVRIAHTPNPLAKGSAFLVVPAISALAWLFFFTIVYGAPDPSAPYAGDTQNSLAYFPNGIGGLLFDQGFGLLATAPVLAFAAAGFVTTRRLALEWLVVALPYVLAVATYAMWWAGFSGPARFLVPLVLPLALPAACSWAAVQSRRVRVLLLAALVVSAWLSAVMTAGAGRLAYHERNVAGLTAAPWLEWANPVVNLPAAFPAFVPQPVQPDPGGLVSRANAARAGFAGTAIWIGCLGAVAWLLFRIFRRPDIPLPTMIAMTTMAFAAGAMLAMSIVWRVQAAERTRPTVAQMDVLRRLAGGPVVALNLSGRQRLSRDEAWGMRIEVPIRRRAAGRLNRPLAAFPAVPAGSYVVSARRQAGTDGWLMIGVGDDQFALVTQPIAAFDQGVRVDVPVAVRALLVRADEGARDQLRSIELRPLARAEPVSPAVARRAVRYGTAAAFFLDDRAFPEPAGFWVAGARETSLVVRPDQPRPVAVQLRNGAAENVVALESGRWREEIMLKPGEERRVDIPLDPARGAAPLRIRSAAGFRPSEVDPGSRDTRFLGVFVRLLEP